MVTTSASLQWHTSRTDEKGMAYFPFKDNEQVKSVQFQKPVAARLNQVEDFKELTSAESTDFVDVGLVSTKCLVVKTEPLIEVKVLTIH